MTDTRQQDFLNDIRLFARRSVEPAATGWSTGQSPEGSLYREAATLGLNRMEIPVRDGGLGLPFAVKVEACRILAMADFGFAMSVINTHNVALRLCLSANASLRTRHLPPLLSGRASACTALTEPGAGSDVAAMQTTARREADAWTLNGEKTWIVNARHAEVAIVFAQCGETGDASGIGAFLVDLSQPGIRQYPIDCAFSQTSIGTGGIVLDNVRVPGEMLLLPPGKAFRAILAEINGARTYVAAMCCGMLEAALAQVATYGESRITFGKRLGEHQGWRGVLSLAKTELAATRALTAEAVCRISAGGDTQLEAAQAKIHAVQACQRHLPELLHAMGAEGLRPEYCLTRHLAATQMAALTDGANSLLLDRVGRLTRPSSSESGE